ncbi:alpha-ketoacid dehydrogenase subunit alpha/beta [Ferruginibacter albus]|uniref:alpha-ketoacid dehydrogenase subunit alpha/beta n=1 Tax=Ferruginibacter albus TaxID=2875540 RepID=UPI001CC6C3AA|nr:alpha-ketoacid dehydrogenase subunit alpha/beta [Ferruginibacter albus]UAY51401.1 transketolase [Ferruginibacter albus]
MDTVHTGNVSLQELSFESFKKEVLTDYRYACISREVSLLGRKEVLTGKAKFGIFGDGKEVPQVAMAKFFKPGDYRAGYYRDQTFMFASNLVTPEQYFSQLFSDPDIEHEPFSGGRQMNAHFASRIHNENGEWLDLVNRKNITSDMAPTASQMPRAAGLAYASKLFRNIPELKDLTHLSNNGNEICFCTIGDASTSEGHFWEAVNAAGVMQIPLAVFVWDDGYGISVPVKYQTTKGSISDALQGLQKEPGTNGIDIYKLKGWDYAGMCEVLDTAIQKIRDTHTPAVFHIEELTQPQGHSTSGSHERYKTPERLAWEREWDCNKKMREWILSNELADEHELSEIEIEVKMLVKEGKQHAWEKYIAPLKELVATTAAHLSKLVTDTPGVEEIISQLTAIREPLRKDVMKALASALDIAANNRSYAEVNAYYQKLRVDFANIFNTQLYNEGGKATVSVAGVEATYGEEEIIVNGYEVLNHYFDELFATNKKVIAFGEDLGMIGDVNQGFAGLQKKHGELRISDTGIRELTIMGKAIGTSFRGLRPIAEIQYLDYVLYAIQTLSDDVCSTHFRTIGQQSLPLIIRTRGHRLEGIWHSGSPMGMIINALRGMYICVPRNMVQAVGLYNCLLKGNDPGMIVESLNGYRLKEKLPSNLLEYTVPLGIPETIREGNDVTIVSYGSVLRIIAEAAEALEKLNISCEIIDVQTLLPFDVHHSILDSLKKTNRILFVDEDVPGGAAAYMFNKVMEEQNGYKWLDVAPRTITSKAHRPSYGSDGDYFSKPNVEDIIRVIKEMMGE